MKCSNCGAEFEGAFCPQCGRQAAFNSNSFQPQQIQKNQKRRKKKKPIYKRWWFIAIILITLIVAINAIKTSVKERIDWSKIVLSEVLPEPDSKRGKIISNSESTLNIDFYKMSDDLYRNYVAKCKEKGFTVDAESSGSSFDAYNDDGYELSIHYFSEEMSITLNAPMEFSSISWPKSKIGKLLPKPKSSQGKFINESEDYFHVYIANISKDDYNDYVDTCADKGFDVDYSKDEAYYSAENKQGYSLDVRYKGNNIMEISISAPDDKDDETSAPETEKTTKAEKTTKEKKTEENEDGIRKEFKAAMDSYEEFMNEYVSFMKKYKESDGTDLKLIADYAEYMKKYSDMVEKFDAWEDDDLSTEETAYYIDVQARVSKKLLEVS